jgi:type II secretory pathway pseudopilin PulG
MCAHGSPGFSRPETVFLLGVVLFVSSLAIPGRFLWVARQREAMARADIRSLVEASRSFYAEYGLWPTTLSGGLEDVRYGHDAPNREVINILRAVDAPGNLGHRTNRRKIAFLEVPEVASGLSGRDEEGNMIDPWGRPYQIVLDASLDNICISPTTVYGRREGEGILVWSCGPDGMSDTRDDLLSWNPDAVR